MKVGDLVQMKDARYHNEIGVVIKESSPRAVKVLWAAGRANWEHTKNLEVI